MSKIRKWKGNFVTFGFIKVNRNSFDRAQCVDRLVVVVVVVTTPPLPRDGGTERTAIQVHAVNLIELD